MADSHRASMQGPPQPHQQQHHPLSQPPHLPQYHGYHQPQSYTYPQSQQQPHGHPKPGTSSQHPPAVKADVLALQQNYPNQASASPQLPPLHAAPPQGRSATSSPAGITPRPSRPPSNPTMQLSSQVHSPVPNGPAPSPSQIPPRDFKSPVSRALPQDDHFNTEVDELKRVMCQSKPAVLRQAVRDLFDLTLLGSDYHNSFLCHTLFHKTPPHIFAKAVKELGRSLIKSTLEQVFEHVDTEDLDALAPQLFPKASTRFLDQALAVRLESIPGRQLVNALAQSERLGYNVEDIVVETANPSKSERVIPAMKQLSQKILSQPSEAVQTATSQPMAWAISADTVKRLGISFCGKCGRPCSGKRALASHLRSAACKNSNASLERLNKDICIHCAQSFSSTGGHTYHIRSHVCGDYTFEVEKTVRELMKAMQPAPEPNAAATPYSSTTQMHNNGGLSNTRDQVPSPVAVSHSSTTPAPKPSSGSGTSDNSPYAKLTPEQRQNFEADMKRVDDHFGKLMAVAMANDDKEKGAAEFTRLKNNYNTKQSLTRKKYGVRLRERRTKTEVEEERQRLLAKADVATKRGRADSGTQNTPSKRIMISEMGGGLSASASTAELNDPTMSAAGTKGTGMSQPQWQARLLQPTQGSVHQPTARSETPNNHGTAGEPMQIADSSDDDTSDDDTV